MQPRHRWPARARRRARRTARRLAAVAVALPLVLLTAPAALAAQSGPETVPGGASGTRFELVAVGLAVGGILVVGGVVLVLFNRPKRSQVVGEDDEVLDEEYAEGDFPEGPFPAEEFPAEAQASAQAYYEEQVTESPPAYHGEPVADEATGSEVALDDEEPGLYDEEAVRSEAPADDEVPLEEEPLEEDADAPPPRSAPVDSGDERFSGS